MLSGEAFFCCRDHGLGDLSFLPFRHPHPRQVVLDLVAVKILTDLFCSAKLNPIKQIFSGFDIAKAQKDRQLIEILMESELKLKQHNSTLLGLQKLLISLRLSVNCTDDLGKFLLATSQRI